MKMAEIPSTFEEAMEHDYFSQLIKTHEQQEQFVRNTIEFYRTRGIHADYRKVRINPQRAIATQEFVVRDEYKLIKKLMKNGEYDTMTVVELHPRFLPDCPLILDGHHRTRRNAKTGITKDYAWGIYFPDGDVWTEYLTIAKEYGNKRAMDMLSIKDVI